MHRLLPVLLLIGFVVLALPKLINDNNQQQSSLVGMVEGKKTEIGETQEGTGDKKFLGNTINKLEKVATTTKNKEIKSELNDVIEETSAADDNIERSIATMEARPKVIKFIMGPDYKNAGQVRSEIVHLENQIRKIDKLEEKTGASESSTLADTKTTLKDELNAIETKLQTGLQGFSLFGWLSKLLSGFSPVSTPTPSGSPIGSPGSTPLATATPTTSPTVSPSATP